MPEGRNIRCDQIRLERIYSFKLKNTDQHIRAMVHSFRVTSSIVHDTTLEILITFQNLSDNSIFQYYNYQIDESTLIEEPSY